MSDTFEVEIGRADGYLFDIRFPGKPYGPIRADEPPPLGEDEAPNAARLLGAAVGNCLCASLVFCLRDSDVELETVQARVAGTLVRNEDNRLRIGNLSVEIDVDTPVPASALDDCIDVFEDFCVVTGSVRTGLDVDVDVRVSGAPREDPTHGELDETPATSPASG